MDMFRQTQEELQSLINTGLIFTSLNVDSPTIMDTVAVEKILERSREKHRCHICSGARYVMFEGKSLPCGHCNFATEKPEDRKPAVPAAPYHVFSCGCCCLSQMRNDLYDFHTPADIAAVQARLFGKMVSIKAIKPAKS